MGITLNWTLQAGLGLDKIVIYRSTSKINLGALPAPLVELAGDVTTYTDPSPASGNVYYYVVSLVKGAQVSFSSNYEMAYFPHYGPGPQTLLRGTWEKGYFGLVPDEDMFTYADFAAQTGIAVSGSTNGWHKFIYKGKILYFPNASTTSYYTTVYNAGAIFGDGTVGQYPAGCAAPVGVIQNRKITRDGYEFICRVPRAPQHNTYITNIAGWAGSELFEILTLCYGVMNTAVVEGKERLGDYAMPSGAVLSTGMMSSSQASLPYLDGGNPTYSTFLASAGYRPLLELVW